MCPQLLIPGRSNSLILEAPLSPVKRQFSEISLALSIAQASTTWAESDDNASSGIDSGDESESNSDSDSEAESCDSVEDHILMPVFVESPKSRKKHHAWQKIKDIQMRASQLHKAHGGSHCSTPLAGGCLIPGAPPHEGGIYENGNDTQALKEGVMRRVAEQMQMALLKNFCERQKCRSRCGSMSGVDDAAERRMDVCDRSNDFTRLNADTISILEANMTLRAPKRRHTVAGGELRHFPTECLSGNVCQR